MKTTFIFLISTFVLFLLPLPIHAQNEPKILGEVETTWPGIHYQITILKRIPPDRLLVVVRVQATPLAPPDGTLLGFPVAIPPGLNPAEAADLYPPKPLSLLSSIMTDDKTLQKFSAMDPVAPPGHEYRPGVTLAILRPGHNVILTIQFPVPPPPPADPTTGVPPAQSVSFLLPMAKGSIAHVTIPPLDTVAHPTN